MLTTQRVAGGGERCSEDTRTRSRSVCALVHSRPLVLLLNSADDFDRHALKAYVAERRAKTGGGNVGGVNGQDMTSVKERQERDALVGKIEAMYAARGRDPPFGLRAATLAALKKHLKTARQLG